MSSLWRQTLHQRSATGWADPPFQKDRACLPPMGPVGQVVTSQQVLATVMSTLLDLGQVRLMPGVPNDISRALASATPIPQLV